jgi:hypothetical protein
MASKKSQRVDRYWKTVRQSAVAPQPDDLVSNAQWDVLTGEPGGVDYLEPAPRSHPCYPAGGSVR